MLIPPASLAPVSAEGTFSETLSTYLYHSSCKAVVYNLFLEIIVQETVS